MLFAKLLGGCLGALVLYTGWGSGAADRDTEVDVPRMVHSPRGPRDDCQKSTQVSSTMVIVCGAPELCAGAGGHGCAEVQVTVGGSWSRWCDCEDPTSLFDYGGCHAAVVHTIFTARECVGLCGDPGDDATCMLEEGTHTYKRCTCQ